MPKLPFEGLDPEVPGSRFTWRPAVAVLVGEIPERDIHELGHALLHGDELPRSKEVAEVEVESVVYIVCDAVELDSGDYSFAYVARWSSGNMETLSQTGERVVGRARMILQALGPKVDGG